MADEIVNLSKPDPVPVEAKPKISLVLPTLNSLGLIAALGFLGYIKLYYKRPTITDVAEKSRILATKVVPSTLTEGIGTVSFGPLTINILPSPDGLFPTSPSSPKSRGKLHYLATAFTLEIRDKAQGEMVKSLKPFILDKLIQIVGKKSFHELATVQGRYILHSQLIDIANQTIARRTHSEAKELLVTNLYFTTFLVQ
ncbi:MAG: flagellar basal body-associated FliL family protein [Bdellovibrionia bacterium]